MSATTPQSPGTSLLEDPFESEHEDQPAPSELDDVEKPVEERLWKFSGTIKGIVRGKPVEELFEREYVQKPLSYLAMMQFTGLLGRKIDEAMSGDEGLSIESITSIVDVASYASGGSISAGILSQGDFAGVDSFVRGFAKIAAYVPDIIAEAQCIWLRVLYQDRPALVEVWHKPVDEGGLSMDEGEEMLRIFIDQNYEELERFLALRLRRIGKTAARARKRLHPEG